MKRLLLLLYLVASMTNLGNSKSTVSLVYSSLPEELTGGLEHDRRAIPATQFWLSKTEYNFSSNSCRVVFAVKNCIPRYAPGISVSTAPDQHVLHIRWADSPQQHQIDFVRFSDLKMHRQFDNYPLSVQTISHVFKFSDVARDRIATQTLAEFRCLWLPGMDAFKFDMAENSLIKSLYELCTSEVRLNPLLTGAVSKKRTNLSIAKRYASLPVVLQPIWLSPDIILVNWMSLPWRTRIKEMAVSVSYRNGLPIDDSGREIDPSDSRVVELIDLKSLSNTSKLPTLSQTVVYTFETLLVLVFRITHTIPKRVTHVAEHKWPVLETYSSRPLFNVETLLIGSPIVTEKSPDPPLKYMTTVYISSSHCIDSQYNLTLSWQVEDIGGCLVNSNDDPAIKRLSFELNKTVSSGAKSAVAQFIWEYRPCSSLGGTIKYTVTDECLVSTQIQANLSSSRNRLKCREYTSDTLALPISFFAHPDSQLDTGRHFGNGRDAIVGKVTPYGVHRTYKLIENCAVILTFVDNQLLVTLNIGLACGSTSIQTPTSVELGNVVADFSYSTNYVSAQTNFSGELTLNFVCKQTDFGQMYNSTAPWCSGRSSYNVLLHCVAGISKDVSFRPQCAWPTRNSGPVNKIVPTGPSVVGETTKKTTNTTIAVISQPDQPGILTDKNSSTLTADDDKGRVFSVVTQFVGFQPLNTTKDFYHVYTPLSGFSRDTIAVYNTTFYCTTIGNIERDHTFNLYLTIENYDEDVSDFVNPNIGSSTYMRDGTIVSAARRKKPLYTVQHIRWFYENKVNRITNHTIFSFRWYLNVWENAVISYWIEDIYNTFVNSPENSESQITWMTQFDSYRSPIMMLNASKHTYDYTYSWVTYTENFTTRIHSDGIIIYRLRHGHLCCPNGTSEQGIEVNGHFVQRAEPLTKHSTGLSNSVFLPCPELVAAEFTRHALRTPWCINRPVRYTINRLRFLCGNGARIRHSGKSGL